MKVEEIAEAVAKLPPDQLARFRRWFTAFEAGRTGHAEELDSTAIKLGRLAGRAFAHRLGGTVSTSIRAAADSILLCCRKPIDYFVLKPNSLISRA